MIIDGNAIASEIYYNLRMAIQKRPGARVPCLGVIQVGDNPSSTIYIRRKTKACVEVGMSFVEKRLPADVTEETVISEIQRLNQDSAIDGILMQLPLPAHLDSSHIVTHIAPHKDVDGLHPINLGKLLMGSEDGFIPCTPLGVKLLLDHSGISTVGQHVVILGRSLIVGKPLANLLMWNHPGYQATVTVVHSQSQDVQTLCASADIIVAAIGKPHFVKADMVKEGAVVIDVGVNRVEDSRASRGYVLVGDVDFNAIAPKCRAITPVPGGVGPMTIAMLLKNTWLSYQRREGLV